MSDRLRRRRLTTTAKGRVFPADALLLIQLIIGLEFLLSGLTKAVRGGFVSGLSENLEAELEEAYTWYQPVLESIVIPNGELFAVLILVGEIAVGLVLVAAALVWIVRWEDLTRRSQILVALGSALANLGGLFMALNFRLSTGAANPFFFPDDPFTEAVDLDTILLLVQAVLAGSQVWLLWSFRRPRLKADDNPDAARVVVAGGGFGGLAAARRLEKLLPPEAAHLTLVSDVNFLLYTPLLPGAAGGVLEPTSVVVPLREQLKRTNVEIARVVGADPDRRVLLVERPTLVPRAGLQWTGGARVEIPYDRLVVALGSIARQAPIPGLAEHAIGLKTIGDAHTLRNRVLGTLELAETIADDDLRAAYVTYVFVGGGFAGVEGIAELQDLADDVLELYPGCRSCGLRWVLLEAGERILPEAPASLAEFAARQLERRGIEIRTLAQLESVDDGGVVLGGGERLPARTVVWCAGVEPAPAVERLGLPLNERGRIKTDHHLRVEGNTNVWAVGDAAAVPDPAAGGERPCPPTAQHATRQGRAAATNVAASLGSGRPHPFAYRMRGTIADLGRRKAVATFGPVRLRGFVAWFLSRGFHALQIPGPRRKLRLLFDWALDPFYGRDTSELSDVGESRSA